VIFFSVPTAIKALSGFAWAVLVGRVENLAAALGMDCLELSPSSPLTSGKWGLWAADIHSRHFARVMATKQPELLLTLQVFCLFPGRCVAG